MIKHISYLFLNFVCFLFIEGTLEAQNTYKEKNMNSIDSTKSNICDLDLIYNTGYAYSLPKNILEGFLSGKSFDNPDFYTKEELNKLKEDIDDLFLNIMSSNPVKKPLAVITAGGPGCGKTILLKQDLKQKEMENKVNYAYICPDDVCLKNMIKTYKTDLEVSDDSFEAHQKAYNKWRPGSNAANHLILANLIREKYAFYFGTTSSGPATGKFFEFLKKQEYKIKLIHISHLTIYVGNLLENAIKLLCKPRNKMSKKKVY